MLFSLSLSILIILCAFALLAKIILTDSFGGSQNRCTPNLCNCLGIIVDSVSVDGPVLRRVHGAGDRGALQAGQERLQCRR